MSPAKSDRFQAVKAKAERRSILQRIAGLPGEALVLAVRGYQLLISPWLGPNCRYHPTCSQYMIASVRKQGLVRGAWRGILRIARCHPWHPGGYDPP
jgi:putative membrane protein insertion efficiency factor